MVSWIHVEIKLKKVELTVKYSKLDPDASQARDRKKYVHYKLIIIYSTKYLVSDWSMTNA